jgi:hypothetical protein
MMATVRPGSGRRLLLAAVSFGLLAPAAARADFHSNPTLPVGEATGLMAGAASAWVNDGSAAWYNPAGLGRAAQRTISANVSAYGFQQVKVPGFVDLGEGSKGGLSSLAVTTFPSYVSYHQSFGKQPGFRHGFALAVVVPDFERVDAQLDIPPASRLVEFRSRLKNVSQTLWTLPAWGACWSQGKFCFGVSLGLGLRTETESIVNDSRVLTMGGTLGYLESQQQDLWMGLLSGSAGFQWQLTPVLRVGAMVRSPIRALTAGGTILHTDARTRAGEGIMRRIEDQHLRLQYRLPLQARGGMALERGGLRLALDVIASPAQPRFAFVRGQNGESQLQPTYFGIPIGDPIGVATDLERWAIVDGALGASLQAGGSWAVVGGVFTNFTGATDGTAENVYGDRFGATLGLSRASGRSTTRVGITAMFGGGQVQGQGVMAGSIVRTSSRAVYLNFGGTVEL